MSGESDPQNVAFPTWWNSSLYDFLSKISQAGWVWEFYRRFELLQLLNDRPVDAMNPEPDEDAIPVRDDLICSMLYKTWADPMFSGKKPIYWPSSVNLTEGWPLGFRGQMFQVGCRAREALEKAGQSRPRKLVEITIDLNRRDSTIVRDFNRLLKTLRKQHSEPEPIRARIKDWRENRILQVWDLRQFSVPWSGIADLFQEIDPIQSARNAYDTARRYSVSRN